MQIVCADGNHQENSKIICEEWFDFGESRLYANQLTDNAKAWLSLNGYSETKYAMCSAFAPWPLYKTNSIEVRAVCQVVCDYCPNGYSMPRQDHPKHIPLLAAWPSIFPSLSTTTTTTEKIIYDDYPDYIYNNGGSVYSY